MSDEYRDVTDVDSDHFDSLISSFLLWKSVISMHAVSNELTFRNPPRLAQVVLNSLVHLLLFDQESLSLVQEVQESPLRVHVLMVLDLPLLAHYLTVCVSPTGYQ